MRIYIYMYICIHISMVDSRKNPYGDLTAISPTKFERKKT